MPINFNRWDIITTGAAYCTMLIIVFFGIMDMNNIAKKQVEAQQLCVNLGGYVDEEPRSTDWQCRPNDNTLRLKTYYDTVKGE